MSDSDAGKLIARIQQATQLLKNGRRADALIIYHDISERAGDNAGVHLQLGTLCEGFGDIDQAITHYEIVVEEAPDNARYLATLGIAYLNANELDKAQDTLEKAAAIAPDRADVHHGLGVFYLQQPDYDQAVTHLEQACMLRPREAASHNNLAMTLANLNRYDEALAHAEKAVKLNSSNPFAHITKSEILAQLGDMEGAAKIAEQLVRKHPLFGGAYDHLARIRKFTEKDAALIKKAEKAMDSGMAPKERWNLLFALGKMHDDCGHYDKAFSCYKQANTLRNEDYDARWDVKLRKAIEKAFTAGTIAALAQHGHSSSQPVFVVGMPRTGTTLIERIIGSHPRGAGAGELSAMPAIGYDFFPAADPRQGIRRVQSELTSDTIESLAENYLAVLRRGNEDTARIVDKLPANAQFLGIIKVLFPNATVIHTMRHPLDTCLSCYFQNFSNLHWANDLKTIGRMYANYRDTMKYWHDVLPEGSILDVHYEDLVEDPESHARRILETCGLDWDPSVLDFHRKESVVRTASVAQTRQPIYKTSKARWTNYASHLEPLATEIAPYLQEDRGWLQEHGIELPPSGSGWLKRLLN